jgi:hypothetical protein
LSSQHGVLALALLFLMSLGGLHPAWSGEPSSGLQYLAVYGKFGGTPLLVLAHPRGVPLTIRLGMGLRQVSLDSATAARLLPDFTPSAVEGLDGVTLYTVPGVSSYDLSYPLGSLPVLSVNDPSESPGGGHDGGGGGGCSCS